MVGGISLCVHSIALELCVHSHTFLQAIYNLYRVSSMVLGTRTPCTRAGLNMRVAGAIGV